MHLHHSLIDNYMELSRSVRHELSNFLQGVIPTIEREAAALLRQDKVGPKPPAYYINSKRKMPASDFDVENNSSMSLDSSQLSDTPVSDDRGHIHFTDSNGTGTGGSDSGGTSNNLQNTRGNGDEAGHSGIGNNNTNNAVRNNAGGTDAVNNAATQGNSAGGNGNDGNTNGSSRISRCLAFLLDPKKMANALLGIGIVTVFLAFSTLFFQPAKGPVFHDHQNAYYTLLISIFFAGTAEIFTALFVSDLPPGQALVGRRRLIIRSVLGISIVVLLIVGVIAGLDVATLVSIMKK